MSSTDATTGVRPPQGAARRTRWVNRRHLRVVPPGTAPDPAERRAVDEARRLGRCAYCGRPLARAVIREVTIPTCDDCWAAIRGGYLP